MMTTACSAFKMIDNYGLYAEDAYGLSRTASATLIAYISFVRVGAALMAGWIADRYLGVRASVQVCFALLLAACSSIPVEDRPGRRADVNAMAEATIEQLVAADPSVQAELDVAVTLRRRHCPERRSPRGGIECLEDAF